MVEVKEQEFLVFKALPPGTSLAYSPASMVRRQFIALILLATSACGGGGSGGKPDSAVTPAGAWVELGTGTDSFEAIAAEGDMLLVAGPQGGHHFIVNAKMHGLQPGDPTMPGTMQNPATRFTVWNESGEQLDVDPPPYHLGYEEVSDGVYALLGGHIIQVREDEVTPLYGARVKLRVEIEDINGARVADERWVVPFEDTSGPDGDAGVPDAGPPAASVEIGTAVDAGGSPFETLAAEGDIVLNDGLQGGHHFYLHSRIQGLVPNGPTTRFRVYDEGGTRVDFMGPLQIDYEAAGGDVYELPNALQVQLDVVTPGAYGDRFRVSVEVTDTDGIQVSDQRWVRAIAP